VQLKALATLKKLAMFGHQLRRPHADYLRDGIYELRLKDGRRNIRILYFFHGSHMVVVSHGLCKEDVVPDREIELAIERKAKYSKLPRLYTCELELADDGIIETEDGEEHEKEEK
jgi:phage-related protein